MKIWCLADLTKINKDTIFTFDIETTSLIKFNDKFYPSTFYDTLSEKEKEQTKSYSFMYIWQMGIDDKVYFGRTWKELRTFLNSINSGYSKKKICYIHNLSFEMQFLRNEFEISKVVARKQRHPMKCEIEEFNFELRCSLVLSNISLAKLSSTYHLKTEKMVGDLDYSLIRNSKTRLNMRELGYCENDCLVLYEYIKLERELNKKVPLTFTGHVRNALKDKIDLTHKIKVRNQTSNNPIVYNRLCQSFAGRLHTC